MDEDGTGPLSAAEIAAYRRDGYLVPRYRLPPAKLAALQALMARLAADNPELVDRPIASPHLPGSGVQGLKVQGGWLEVATDPPILDMVAQLAGPDLVLWGTTVFYKRAGGGPATAWHRDAQSWPMIKPPATTSVWIAATDSTVDNGCLRVIPGSHAGRTVGRHGYADPGSSMVLRSLAAEEFDAGTAKDVVLEAGQMVLFDIFTVHGGRANPTGRPRAGYALRLMPATSHFDHDAADHRGAPGYAHDTRPLLLVRGIDRCGLNDFIRGHVAA